MKDEEHKIQSAFFCHVRQRAAYDENWRFVFAIPNGGARDVRVAAKLKREGVLAGVLDVFVPICAGGFGGLWIEFKTPKGRIQPNQKEFITGMKERGYCVEVCRSAQEGVSAIEKYLLQ